MGRQPEPPRPVLTCPVFSLARPPPRRGCHPLARSRRLRLPAAPARRRSSPSPPHRPARITSRSAPARRPGEGSRPPLRFAATPRAGPPARGSRAPARGPRPRGRTSPRGHGAPGSSRTPRSGRRPRPAPPRRRPGRARAGPARGRRRPPRSRQARPPARPPPAHQGSPEPRRTPYARSGSRPNGALTLRAALEADPPGGPRRATRVTRRVRLEVRPTRAERPILADFRVWQSYPQSLVAVDVVAKMPHSYLWVGRDATPRAARRWGAGAPFLPTCRQFAPSSP